jgi:hypothetical protein
MVSPMKAFQRWLVRVSGSGFYLLFGCWFAYVAVATVMDWRPKIAWVQFFVFTVVVMAMIMMWGKWRRERFVREGPLPQFPKRQLRLEFPQLSVKDCDLVERGLRQFFLASVRSGKKPVAMPSVIVGHLWREFARNIPVYEEWCELAFGRVLPHHAAHKLGHSADQNDALRRTWFWSCRDEAIKPSDPTRLPILFALDTKFSIPGGIVYQSHHRDFAQGVTVQGDANIYFSTSFSDDQYTGSCDDFGGAEGSSGDGDGGSSGGDGGGGD